MTIDLVKSSNYYSGYSLRLGDLKSTAGNSDKTYKDSQSKAVRDIQDLARGMK